MSMADQTGLLLNINDPLARIKLNVEKAYMYFKPNYEMFNNFRKLVFDTALDSESISVLKTLKKPQIEFNILESYVSRLRGEFSKQEPSIEVMAGDEEPVDIATINVVQGHIKHIINEANKDGCEYHVYSDTLSGGFSVMKVWTEYAHELSFNQVIKIGRVFDPVLCGFDPLAQLPHKGDGSFCFELYPRLKTDFEKEYPDVDVSKLSFTKNIQGFNWSYKNERDDIILICDYYEKEMVKKKIVQLVNGKVMYAEDYKDFVEEWDSMGFIEAAPEIMGEPRETEITTIKRFRFIENTILEEKKTNFKMLPLVFVDGNSMMLRHPNDNAVEQKCRPYVYNARGIQKLKNFAGQSLANEFENMIQHKFKVAKEAIPLEEDYMQAYRDVQQADVLVYNSFNELQPDKQLPPPEVIQRAAIPPELVNTFVGADNMTQNILGNFDMDIAKMNSSQISGVAVVEAATLNNSAAMPYIVGFLQGLNRISEIIIDLIPKYFRTPRTIPIVLPDGSKGFEKVNEEGKPNLQYANNALNVRVEAGVNFSVQRSKALSQIIALMQASPLFAQFMNQEGLEILLDNIEIKGIDTIKEMAKQWQEQMRKVQQQQLEAQANQGNPALEKIKLEQAKLAQKGQENSSKLALDVAKLKQDQIKIIADLKQSHENNLVQTLKAQTERFSREVDLALKGHDQRHRHAKEVAEHHLKHKVEHHKMSQGERT
jgi:hypothetical protein